MKRILLAVMLGIGVLGFTQDKKNIVKTEIVDNIRDYGCEIQKNSYRFCVRLT